MISSHIIIAVEDHQKHDVKRNQSATGRLIPTSREIKVHRFKNDPMAYVYKNSLAKTRVDLFRRFWVKEHRHSDIFQPKSAALFRTVQCKPTKGPKTYGGAPQ